MKEIRPYREVKNNSDEAWNRLSKAILLQTKTDYLKYIRQIKIYSRSPHRLGYVYFDLANIFLFIESEWFQYLTNYNCPQKDIFFKLYNALPEHVNKDRILEIMRKRRKIFEKNCLHSKTFIV